MKIQFEVLVSAGSKHGSLIEANTDGSMKIYLREKALDGKSNIKIIELISTHYEVPKSQVQIIKGLSSKYKLIRIN